MILLKTTFLGVLILADTSAASPVAQVTLRALFCSSSHGWFSTQSATAVQTRCPNVDVASWTIVHNARSRGLRPSLEGRDVPVRQAGRPDGGHRDRGPARVPRPGLGAHPRHGARHHAVRWLVCQSTARHAGQTGARRRGRAARHRPRATAGADRSRPSLGGPVAADLRSRPARVSDVSWAYADHRVHHPGVGNRPDPHQPPRPRGPRRRTQSPIDTGLREPWDVTRPSCNSRTIRW